MLRLDLNFPKEFVELYNKFNLTQKGKDFLHLSGISREKLDIASISKEYFNGHTSDISVDPNANVGQTKNLNTFTSEVTKGLAKLDGYFLLWKYIEKTYGIDEANYLISKCLNGQYYPHDLTKISVPYCVAISTFNIMLCGRPYGTLKSKPPKRASSFIAQCIEHLMTSSQEFAGAVALGDLLVNYAWFINQEFEGVLEDKEELEFRSQICCGDLISNIEKKIENDFQSFVHVANNNFRIGGDSPFSNVSLYCRRTLKNMFEHYRYPDGTSPLDIIETIMQVQKIFMRFISKKDPESGFPYRFPIVTVSLFVDKDNKKVEDIDFLETLAEHNTEGVFNIYITNDIAKIASCCRMTSDKTSLMKYRGIDSFGNGGLNIGSHRVVTINLVRLARKSKKLDQFKLCIKKSMEDCAKILVCHRQLIKDRVEQNFLQFFKPLRWLDLDTMFFSTIGIIGLNEAMSILGIDLCQDQTETVELLQYCNSILNDLAGQYQVPFNLEQIPGESASVNLAKKDRVYFGDSTDVLYSNQFIPLWKDIDLVSRAKIDGKLSGFFGGGVISHLNISSKTSKQQMIDLITFASSCGLDHFALNSCFSRCEEDHISITNGEVCPICGKLIVEKLTRVVGYFTPVTNWVKERREYEFPLRKFTELNI